MLAVQFRVSRDFFFADFDAQTGAVDASPAGCRGDRKWCLEDVVCHHRSSLLGAVAGIGDCQENMLRGGGGDSKFTVSVLADSEPFQVGDLAECVKTTQCSYPVTAKAEYVCTAAANHAVGIRCSP